MDDRDGDDESVEGALSSKDKRFSPLEDEAVDAAIEFCLVISILSSKSLIAILILLELETGVELPLVMMDSGTKALFLVTTSLLSVMWEEDSPFVSAMLISLLLWLTESEERDDEREAFEGTKEQRQDSMVELLFEVLPDSLLAFVGDRFTPFTFVPVRAVAGGCKQHPSVLSAPFLTVFFVPAVSLCCSPSESEVALELIRLPLSLVS
jgi:hypothetical protein